MFFPDVAFAWVFCATLILLTSVAAYVDTKKAIIPNRLNVLILILGVVANVVRGGWLASEGKAFTWPLGDSLPDTAWLGALYGFLFAILGFVIVFAAMFVVWIFGLCGGGDVKLLGAVGGWVGLAMVGKLPVMLLLWLGSGVALFVWTAARIFSKGVSARQLNRAMARMKKPNRTGTQPQGKDGAPRPGKLRMTYSLPVAVATTVVLVWIFRSELQLAPLKAPPQPQQAVHHVAPAYLPEC